MSRDETTSDGIGPADVAFAARRMALVALRIEFRANGRVGVNRPARALLEEGVITLHRRMETRCGKIVCNRIMASRADVFAAP